MGLLRNLERGTDAGDRSDRQIGREAESLAHFAIALALDQHFVRRMNTAANVGDVVASRSERFERGIHLGCLLTGRLQLEDDRSHRFHRDDRITLKFTYKREGGLSSPSRRAGRGFSAAIR
jgi:hypothetical protein